MPAGPGPRSAKRRLLHAQGTAGARPSSGATPRGPQLLQVPWAQPSAHRGRTLPVSPLAATALLRLAHPFPLPQPRQARPFPAPRAGLWLTPYRRCHLPAPTAKTTTAMSGRRRQFKTRAAALSAPHIGCRPHSRYASRLLIGRLCKRSRLLPRPFGHRFLSCFLIGFCTCRSRLGGLPLAEGRFLVKQGGLVRVQVADWVGSALR